MTFVFLVKGKHSGGAIIFYLVLVCCPPPSSSDEFSSGRVLLSLFPLPSLSLFPFVALLVAEPSKKGIGKNIGLDGNLSNSSVSSPSQP